MIVDATFVFQANFGHNSGTVYSPKGHEIHTAEGQNWRVNKNAIPRDVPHLNSFCVDIFNPCLHDVF